MAIIRIVNIIVKITAIYKNSEKILNAIYKEAIVGEVIVSDDNAERVGVSMGMTLNMGDFESIRGDVHIDAPVGKVIDKEAVVLQFKKLKEISEPLLKDILNEVNQIRGE